jgi:hypothetical protein
MHWESKTAAKPDKACLDTSIERGKVERPLTLEILRIHIRAIVNQPQHSVLTAMTLALETHRQT